MFHHHKHDHAHKDHKDHHHRHSDDVEVVEVVQTGVPVTSNTSVVSGTAADVERRAKPAALVQENVHHKEELHVQDVLTRDVEKTEVHQITQPIHETAALPTQHHEKVLEAKHIEKNYDRGVAPMAVPSAHTSVDKTTVAVEHAPVVQERVHKKIIEEVQPLVSRDVIQTHHVDVKQPIHEHIVEAPVVIQHTAPVIESTTATSGLPAARVEGYQMSDIDRDRLRTDHHLSSTTGTTHHTSSLASGSTLPAATSTHHTSSMTSASALPVAAATSTHHGHHGGIGNVIHQVFKGETLNDATLVGQTGGNGGTLGAGATSGLSSHPVQPGLVGGQGLGAMAQNTMGQTAQGPNALHTGPTGPSGLGRRDAKHAEKEIERGVGNIDLDGRDRGISNQAK